MTDASGLAHCRDSFEPHWEEGYDVVAVRRGYRSGVLRNFEGIATLRLARSSPTRVRVRITPDSVLPEPPHRLDITLEWLNANNEDDPRRLDPLPPEECTSPDVIEFEVDDPGTYIIAVSASVRTGDLWPSHPHADSRMTYFIGTQPSDAAVITVEHGQRTEDVEIRIIDTRAKPEGE